MRCPSCGFENPSPAHFCAECGKQLASLCPHCRAPAAPGFRFCTSCGGALATAEPGAELAREAPASERRLVSVLFCDLEGFTALAEGLDPEEVRDILSRYFETARSVVARYGGTIEKFIGDAVMAVWGAPTAHEDDIERAVRAALELTASVRRLGGAASGSGLAARAAVATGEAAVTIGAEGEGMVAGDLVNTAARLQGIAPSGAVLVNEATRQAASSVMVFEPAGSHSLKGKATAVAAFRAVGPAGDEVAARGGHSAPFADREGELRMLIDVFHAVSRDRRSRLVSIVGSAGLGKSRLVWELYRYLDGLDQLVHWHLGRVPSYGEGIAFAPLSEMVRRRARIAEGEESEVARRKLAATLDELVRDDAERQWMEPRLALLLGPADEVQHDRDELFAAWRRFFERVSESAATVLVFEDLQSAHAGVIDFVEHLAEWARDHPILIVTIARPELLELRRTWGAGQRSFTTLHLDPLPQAAVHELVNNLVGGPPGDVARRIALRADGVPLYVVEMVRMLIDRNILVPDGDGHALAEPLDERVLPHSLRALISARIDALPPRDRSLLLSGAVLGRRFHPDALAAITGADTATVGECLRQLGRRELAVLDDEPRSPGRGQVSFVQELVHDVAYRTLSRRERRGLHVAAARYLESLADEELVEALAGHLLEALRADPARSDVPELASAARRALRRAAQRALAMHAPDRALAHLEQALAIVDEPRERAALLRDAAAAARAAAQFDDAERHLRTLLQWAVEHEERDAAAQASAQLASLLLMLQRNDSAVAELDAALTAVGDLTSDPASIGLAGQLARAHMLRGAHREAVTWADRALSGAEGLELGVEATEALITRGTARIRIGHDESGLADLNQAIANAEAAGFLTAELRARNNLAWLLVTDDPHRTLAIARRGFELAREMGVGDWTLQLADVASAAAIDTGDWELAATMLADLAERPMAPSHRIDFGATSTIIRALRGVPEPDRPLQDLQPFDPETDPQTLGAAHHAAAWVAFLSRRFAEARELAEREIGESVDTFLHDALALAMRAALWDGDAEAASRLLERLERLGVRGRAAEATRLTLRAGADAVNGRREEAEAAYRSAAERLGALRLPAHLALCLIEHNRFGNPDSERAREATALLEPLGALGMMALAAASGPAAPPPPAQPRRPTARTAARSGAGRHRRRASDPPTPLG